MFLPTGQVRSSEHVFSSSSGFKHARNTPVLAKASVVPSSDYVTVHTKRFCLLELLPRPHWTVIHFSGRINTYLSVVVNQRTGKGAVIARASLGSKTGAGCC